MVDIGLLILRLALGSIFIGHGGQKMFGWFGGHGINGTIGMMGKMGLRPAWLWGLLASLSEFAGGIFILLGFLFPIGSLGIIASMLVAIVQVHWPKGFWNTTGGIEFPLLNLATALALAITGPGKYSVDAVFRTSLPEPASLLIGLALVVLGILASQVTRSQTPRPAT